MNLKNSVIVVTGAAGGLGSEIARRAAAGGALLALIDRTSDASRSLCSALVDSGQQAASYGCDITDEGQVDGVFAAIGQELGPVKAVVNCAGILDDGLLIKPAVDGGFERMSLSQWQRVLDVNLTGTFLCGRAGAQAMASHGEGGVIINISSVARAGNMGQSNYSASKAAVVALTVTWARELARYGIRVAAIAPGMVDTGMAHSLRPEVQARLVDMAPLKRLATPQEIADAACFILTNGYFNGRVLEIDGGLRL